MTFWFFPPRAQRLLLMKPWIQTMVVLSCAFRSSSNDEQATALISVLATVFPDLLDSSRDLVLCTLSTNDLDGGLFFWSLSWNCSLLSLLGSIGLLSVGTELLGWDLCQPSFNWSFKGLNSPSTKHEISLSWYLVKLPCAFASPASIACYVLSVARVLLLALLELSLPFLEGLLWFCCASWSLPAEPKEYAVCYCYALVHQLGFVLSICDSAPWCWCCSFPASGILAPLCWFYAALETMCVFWAWRNLLLLVGL